jgi:tetratricopeptide (TPR) repeat protein
MNLADTALLEKCSKSYELIYSGNYEQAIEELGDLWPGIGEHPSIKNPDLLFICGTLSHLLGSDKRLDVQEKAKDLLSEALQIFQSQNQRIKASETQYELSICYFRCGDYDNARIILDEALAGLEHRELKAKILIRKTIIEIWSGRYYEAWEMLDRARDVFENLSPALKGRWYGQRALVLRKLATSEQRSDYADRAIIEFTAAIVHYEEAKHERYCAINLNNLAMLLYRLKRYDEAHENLDKAHRILDRLQDNGLLAQVDETRARVLLSQERYDEAKRIIIGVVDSFEKSKENALLADALIIKATVNLP